MLKHTILSLAFALGTVASAQAVVPGPVTVQATQDGVMTVSGGCGPYAFRGPYGGCRPIQPAYRPCPPGFHLGPYGGRCWPNR